jgi:transporter family-2 protein
VIYTQQGNGVFSGFHAQTRSVLLIAGLLGIFVIAGLAFSLPKIGVAAGLGMIITGQMVVGVIVDTFGLTGDPIPLSVSRLGGLVLLAFGTWLIVPK